eukprot:1144957-Pelagomonas_calceolata.AAC.1
MYVRQQQQHAAWQPTPEGLNAFRAGRASGFADGYKSGVFLCSIQDLRSLLAFIHERALLSSGQVTYLICMYAVVLARISCTTDGLHALPAQLMVS